MLNDSTSHHREPIVTLGIPDHDVTNRAALVALAAVAFVFLLCILTYAVASSDDDGTASVGDGSAAQATVVTIEDWAGAAG